MSILDIIGQDASKVARDYGNHSENCYLWDKYSYMKPIEVIRRPKVCPKCGGEILDILYGMPTATWEEDYFKKTGHHASLGGCCIEEDMPDYVCKDCETEFIRMR